ncbi:type II toxin-antitoxin system ParD family antitoxin, partial [Sinorhizobium meliloti]|nr:type II toxin-antitoxin system ParD family antitoxin [Sinorhizobium meliloti]
EGVAAYDKLKANPSRALSVDQVRQHLASKRKRSDPA